jgi:hypothetical protein
MPHVVWKLSVARCVSLVAFPPSHVACRLSHFPRCKLHVVNYLLHNFQWSPAARCPLDRVYVPFLCCMSHVLRCMWSVACCPSQCPMSHGVRCLSPGPTSHLICCMLRVPRRLLHVAYRPLRVARCLLSRLACCMSHAACCPSQSDTAPSHTQRIAAALAIERLGGRRGPLQCRPRCACVRVCVRACVPACG